jgi:cytochrome c biogenesis protein CcmG/thiol:disulfide interchange protein DsbE
LRLLAGKVVFRSVIEKRIYYYSRVRRVFYSGPVILILVSILPISACHNRSRLPRIGSVAPDFTVGTMTLSHFRGQVVVLNFWATWCLPCVQELPSFDEMQRRMRAKGVTVIAVSVDVDENAYRKFVAAHNVKVLTVRDATGKTSAMYGTFKYPETYIIDRKGVLQRKFMGAVDWTEPEMLDFLGKL